MIDVTVVEAESTSMGEMVEVLIEKSVAPSIGMMLMDAESETWEITAILHDTSRITEEDHVKRWTFQCKPVSSEKPISKGDFKLLH